MWPHSRGQGQNASHPKAPAIQLGAIRRPRASRPSEAEPPGRTDYACYLHFAADNRETCGGPPPPDHCARTRVQSTRRHVLPGYATATLHAASKHSGAQSGITGSNMIVSPWSVKLNVTSSGNSFEMANAWSSTISYVPSSTGSPFQSRDPNSPSGVKKCEWTRGTAPLQGCEGSAISFGSVTAGISPDSAGAAMNPFPAT